MADARLGADVVGSLAVRYTTRTLHSASPPKDEVLLRAVRPDTAYVDTFLHMRVALNSNGSVDMDL